MTYLAVLLALTLGTAVAPSPSVAPLPSATPVGSASPAPPAFQGVRLGESARALVATMGDPLGTHADGPLLQYAYIARGDDAIVFVQLARGRVARVLVRPTNWPATPAETLGPPPSALGVKLGDPGAATLEVTDAHLVLTTTHAGALTSAIYRAPNGIVYTFGVGGTPPMVQWIEANLVPTGATPPPAPAPVAHSGTSIADAIVIRAPDESVGVRSEYLYVFLHPCASNGTWHTVRQRLLKVDARFYDRLDERCTVGGAQRPFYFDITNYYGKLQR